MPHCSFVAQGRTLARACSFAGFLFFWSMMKPRRNFSPVDGKRLSRARNIQGYSERKTIGAVSAPPVYAGDHSFFQDFSAFVGRSPARSNRVRTHAFFSFVTFSNFQACFWIFRTEIRVSDNKTVEKRQSFLRNTGVGEVCSSWGRDNTTVEQHRFCSDGRTVDVLRRQHRFYFLPLICPFFASPLCSGR